MTDTRNVIPLEQCGINDVEVVGGKNASLGEMIQNLTSLGVQVPGGFATTAHAYRSFLAHDGLSDKINSMLASLDVDDIQALQSTGGEIRRLIMELPFPEDLEKDIETSYAGLEKEYGKEVSWAVRSSATAEDLPEASFAGQQETFLNVSGLENIKRSIREVFASLFNDRAIAYRVHQGFAHELVSLSAGIQKMVRSDIGSSGVMFTVDTESGFEDVVFITSSFGLGEMVVQGAVNPDEFYVYKPALASGKTAMLRRSLGTKAIKMIYQDEGDSPVTTVDVPEDQRKLFSLNPEQVEDLARHAVVIEKHYGRPMDVEWALDGLDNRLYIVQARPETVQSQTGASIERFLLNEQSTVLTEGRSIGQKIGSGKIRVLKNLEDMDDLNDGDVLVTDMTDPDWEPVMKRASAIVTNRGGRTCHAAIIARELGVPAVVGCGDATSVLMTGEDATVSCAEGETGFIYEGLLDYKRHVVELDGMPPAPCKIMMNVGNPDRAMDFANLPNAGVGLARLEFIINNTIGIHPKALLDYDSLTGELRQTISDRIASYGSGREYYVKKLQEGIATIGAAFAPDPVIVRLSDFKSNEYASLIGGDLYEPGEENPMIGYRGAYRYLAEDFQECFKMEVEAIKFVREEMGLENIWVMVPFVRTVQQAKDVIALLESFGLKRGEHNLKLIMMCEVPSNAILADQFLEHFDGFSIGSNDLTQLTLALDRDSGIVSELFDERDEAVKFMLSRAIKACKEAGKYVGICGQGPSDHKDLAGWLLEEGIESMSLNPDTVIDTWIHLAGGES